MYLSHVHGTLPTHDVAKIQENGFFVNICYTLLNMAIRINKFLADHGVCSRRGADAFINEGKVTVNGKKATIGMKIEEGDDVIFDTELIGKKRPKMRYIIFNKPIGLITTTDESKPDNVISCIKINTRVYPVGRLDVESSGLLLFTNDGDLTNKITHPRYSHEKEYEVRVNKSLTDECLGKMASGLRLKDGKTKTAHIEQLSDKEFSIILKEGRNRQIRRMCEAVGYTVLGLKRVRIMNVKLGDLELGNWRDLNEQELDGLMKATEGQPRPLRASGE